MDRDRHGRDHGRNRDPDRSRVDAQLRPDELRFLSFRAVPPPVDTPDTALATSAKMPPTAPPPRLSDVDHYDRRSAHVGNAHGDFGAYDK